MAKNRIAELRQQQLLKQQESLKSEHLSAKLKVEQAHLEEFNGFNAAWDSRMREFEEQAKAEEEAMERRHKEHFAGQTEFISKKLPEKAKPSAEVLNLKKIQTNLAKQKE